MPIQTAPSTITVAVTGGNTVFTLMDVNDDTVTYRAATVGGEAITQVAQMPILTIQRRKPSKANPNTKFTLRLVCSAYNMDGIVIGTSTHQHEWVAGALYAPHYAGTAKVELEKALNLVGNDATLVSAFSDDAWFR